MTWKSTVLLLLLLACTCQATTVVQTTPLELSFKNHAAALTINGLGVSTPDQILHRLDDPTD
ncbi:MAG: hypothetical protein V1834_02270, partial [Candidatus Micrarchaeota archaeon]